MGRINWDSFLEPPDEKEVKVAECARCDEPLYAGDRVMKDRDSDDYFCDEPKCCGGLTVDLVPVVLNYPDKAPEDYLPELEDDDN